MDSRQGSLTTFFGGNGTGRRGCCHGRFKKIVCCHCRHSPMQFWFEVQGARNMIHPIAEERGDEEAK
jgi:hypothetical protein